MCTISGKPSSFNRTAISLQLLLPPAFRAAVFRLAVLLPLLLSAGCNLGINDDTDKLFDDIDLNDRYASFYLASCNNTTVCTTYLSADQNFDFSAFKSACSGQWLDSELCPYSTEFGHTYDMYGLCESTTGDHMTAVFYYESGDIIAILDAESTCSGRWIGWTDL